MNMDNVTVYTSRSCHYCDMIKDYLREKNVQFVEKNVDQDSEARAFLIKNRIMGVPTTYIGDVQVTGFDKEKIDELLGL